MIGLSLGLPSVSVFRRSTPAPSTPAPSNSVAPVVTGTTTDGQTLTASQGTWANATSYAYQWRRGSSDIAGATASTRLLATADVGELMSCRVTATGDGGSTSVTSAQVGPVAAAAAERTAQLWRFNFSDPINGGQQPYMCEVDLRATSGGADLTTTSTPYTSTAGNTEGAVTNLRNNNLFSYWVPNATAFNVDIDMGSAVQVNYVAVAVYFTAHSHPRAFNVQYWDGSAWVTVKSFAGIVWAAANTLQEFSLLP